MRFDSLEAFIMMDGHGFYVWLAYAITLAVLMVNLWWPRVTRHRFILEEKRASERRGDSV